MARFNKIYAGPVTQVTPQVREAPAADGNIKPGNLIVLSSGEFTRAGATTAGKVWVAQDNYLAGKGVDDAYAQDDVVIGMELLDEQFFNVRVATGVNISAIGTPGTPGANGTVAIASTSDLVIGYFEEVYNNASGADQLVRFRAATNGQLTAAS
jgi:hypothetical protein